jgi:DivIVA domain-containing protein
MPLTPEDVANKQFTSTRLKPGYDETEVDEFLDEVEAELTRLYRENDELRSKVAAGGRPAEQTAPQQAAAPAAPAAPDPALARENEELRQKLAATQRQLTEAANRPQVQAPTPAPAAQAPPTAAPSETATGILALAQRTADEHIAEARTQADRIIGEARTRAEQLKREADDKHRQMIGSLETERSGLEREVEKLRSFEREYRSRLKSYLEGQLRELDGRTGEAGAAAPAAAATGQQSGQPQGQQSPAQQSPAQQSPGQPARSPFAPGAPVGGDSPSGPPQQPQGFGEG